MNKIIKNTIKALIFALPVVALVSPMNMFFPFITGKAFLFRVAVELAFFLYIALAISDAEYRPKWNALTIAFAVFAAVMLVADIFAIDASKALWSNFERMDGYVTLAHLFMYFIVASSVLKTKKDWLIWQLSAVAISVYMIFFCFLQLSGEAVINQGGTRVDGSLGNAAYLAAYLVFQFFFLMYLWISEKVDLKHVGRAFVVGGFGYVLYYLIRISQSIVGASGQREYTYPSTKAGMIILIIAAILSIAVLVLQFSRRINAKYLQAVAHFMYGIIAVSYLAVLYETATRGAILGLIGGAFAGALYLAFKAKDDIRVRNISIGIIVGVCVLVGGFYFLRSASFVKNSPVLSRFSSISWDEAKGQARNFIWPMALKGFAEHPVLGWGQEGFNYVFQKYYVPEMFTQEPWFDRAHNAFLDWLVAGGALGFLAYISLYIVAIVLIWRSVVFSEKEKAVLLALILAYAFQNLFIFDNLLSYILFVTFLALVSALHRHPKEIERQTKSEEGRIALLSACLVCFVAIALLVNAKGYLQNITLIKALSPQAKGIEENLALFQKAISYNSFGTYESREHFSNYSFNIIGSKDASVETKSAFARAAAGELKKQTKEYSQDSRALLIFGSYLSAVAMYSDPQDAVALFDEAIFVLNKAKDLSPKKQQIYFELAKAYLMKGSMVDDPAMKAKGLETIKYAYDLAPDSDNIKTVYISFLLSGGQGKEAAAIAKTIKDPTALVNEQFIKAFVEAGFAKDMIVVIENAIKADPSNADAYVQLSNIYLLLKDKASALKSLDRMAEVIPSSKADADANKKIIEQGLR